MGLFHHPHQKLAPTLDFEVIEARITESSMNPWLCPFIWGKFSLSANKSRCYHAWIFLMWKCTFKGSMEVFVLLAPKTSKSQVGANLCCGWGNYTICSVTHLQIPPWCTWQYNKEHLSPPAEARGWVYQVWWLHFTNGISYKIKGKIWIKKEKITMWLNLLSKKKYDRYLVWLRISITFTTSCKRTEEY